MMKCTNCYLWVIVFLQSGILYTQPFAKVLDTKPKGPNMSRTLNLLAEIHDKDVLKLIEGPDNEFAPIDILNDQVYFDQNEYSNVFYYIPGSFQLGFNKRKGNYEIKLAYPEEGDNKGKVNFTAKFVSSVNQVMEDLLEKLLYQITGKLSVKVVPLTFDSKPIVEFPFSDFNIKNITISENSDYTKPITISWSLKADEVQNFLIAMAHEISFDGKIFLDKNSADPKELPIHMSILSAKTIGGLYYKKPSTLLSDGFKNQTAFPIKLNKIVVLNNKKSKKLIYKKYPIFGVRVKPRSTFKDFDSAIKREIRNLPSSNLLLEYEILDCEDCETNAVYSILNNRITSINDQVVITDYNAYHFTKANEIKLRIENIYKEILINKSESDENGIISNFAKTNFEAPKKISGELFYKYRVLIYVNERSTPYVSRLITSNEPSIDINEGFIKKHFREFRYKKL